MKIHSAPSSGGRENQSWGTNRRKQLHRDQRRFTQMGWPSDL